MKRTRFCVGLFVILLAACNTGPAAPDPYVVFGNSFEADRVVVVDLDGTRLATYDGYLLIPGATPADTRLRDSDGAVWKINRRSLERDRDWDPATQAGTRSESGLYRVRLTNPAGSVVAYKEDALDDCSQVYFEANDSPGADSSNYANVYTADDDPDDSRSEDQYLAGWLDDERVVLQANLSSGANCSDPQACAFFIGHDDEWRRAFRCGALTELPHMALATP